LPENVGLGWKW